jgi:hypothetical protein
MMLLVWAPIETDRAIFARITVFLLINSLKIRLKKYCILVRNDVQMCRNNIDFYNKFYYRRNRVFDCQKSYKMI